MADFTVDEGDALQAFSAAHPAEVDVWWYLLFPNSNLLSELSTFQI